MENVSVVVTVSNAQEHLSVCPKRHEHMLQKMQGLGYSDREEST